MKLPTSIGSVRCRCWDSSPTAEAVEEAEAEQEQRRQHQQKRQWQTTAKAIEAAEAAGDEEDERRRGGAEGHGWSFYVGRLGAFGRAGGAGRGLGFRV